MGARHRTVVRLPQATIPRWSGGRCEHAQSSEPQPRPMHSLQALLSEALTQTSRRSARAPQILVALLAGPQGKEKNRKTQSAPRATQRTRLARRLPPTCSLLMTGMSMSRPAVPLLPSPSTTAEEARERFRVGTATVGVDRARCAAAAAAAAPPGVAPAPPPPPPLACGGDVTGFVGAVRPPGASMAGGQHRRKWWTKE